MCWCVHLSYKKTIYRHMRQHTCTTATSPLWHHTHTQRGSHLWILIWTNWRFTLSTFPCGRGGGGRASCGTNGSPRSHIAALWWGQTGKRGWHANIHRSDHAKLVGWQGGVLGAFTPPSIEQKPSKSASQSQSCTVQWKVYNYYNYTTNTNLITYTTLNHSNDQGGWTALLG